MSNIDRTARGPAENCTGLVTTKTLAQLRTSDFGVWFGPEFAGEGIRTIQEIFARYGTRTRYYIETKTPFAELRPGTEEKLLAAMDAYDLRQPARDRCQVIIQSFSPESLVKIHALDPELPLVAGQDRRLANPHDSGRVGLKESSSSRPRIRAAAATHRKDGASAS